ncbi:MAG: hypothetical protein COA91_07575 [Robiginitomaculum sp.]|nr:MAG: hypothetical protein COA91_07575 [Robiginitomaculum sp.]
MTNQFTSFSEPIRRNETLHKMAAYKTYPAKTMILNEDDQGGSVYFILDGKVNITGYSARGREIWYSKLGPGQSFGEMAALTGGVRSASVVAAVETKTAIITKAQFLSLLENNSDISMWLLRELVFRLDKTTNQLYERVALNMTMRMCSKILSQCSEMPNQDGEYAVFPNLVLAQVARQLNTDRENISRTISELVKEGVLRRDGRKLFVLNKIALKAKVEDV